MSRRIMMSQNSKPESQEPKTDLRAIYRKVIMIKQVYCQMIYYKMKLTSHFTLTI